MKPPTCGKRSRFQNSAFTMIWLVAVMGICRILRHCNCPHDPARIPTAGCGQCDCEHSWPVAAKRTECYIGDAKAAAYHDPGRHLNLRASNGLVMKKKTKKERVYGFPMSSFQGLDFPSMLSALSFSEEATYKTFPPLVNL